MLRFLSFWRVRKAASAPATLAGLSRRDLGRGLGFGLVSGAVPGLAQAAPSGFAALAPAQRDTLLRGLAAVEGVEDAGLTARGAEVLAELAVVMPEAPALHALYRLFPAGQSERGVWRREVSVDLARVEQAIAQTYSLHIIYRDLQGQLTSREVLPLALVYPDHGIFLLAWCCKRQAYRQFFAHALQLVEAGTQQFATRRIELLTALVAHHQGRQSV